MTGLVRNRARAKGRISGTWWRLLVAAACIGLSVPTLAQSDDDNDPSAPKTVRFTGAEEDIKRVGQDFDFGDTIETSPDTGATIELDEAILSFRPDSTAVIQENTDGAKVDIEIDVKRGGLKFWIKELAGIFRVKHGKEIRMANSGTVFEVTALDNGVIHVRVYEGEVTIDRRHVAVEQGNQTLVMRNGESLLPSPLSPWDSALLLQDLATIEPEDPPLIELVDPERFIRDF